MKIETIDFKEVFSTERMTKIQGDPSYDQIINAKQKNKRPSPKHPMLPSSLINTRVRMDPLHQDRILHQDRTRKHSQSTTRSRSLYRNQCNSTITMVRWTRTIHPLLKNQQANSSAYSKHLWRRHFHRPGRWGRGLGKSDTSRPLWPPVNGIRGRT